MGIKPKIILGFNKFFGFTGERTGVGSKSGSTRGSNERKEVGCSEDVGIWLKGIGVPVGMLDAPLD